MKTDTTEEIMTEEDLDGKIVISEEHQMVGEVLKWKK
jgi:hypothetical protein